MVLYKPTLAELKARLAALDQERAAIAAEIAKTRAATDPAGNASCAKRFSTV